MASSSQPRGDGGLFPGPGPKSEEHRHRRRFIGPMPENVLTLDPAANRQAQKRRWFASSSRVSVSSQGDEDHCIVRDVIKAYAYEFFKGHGGKDEDWGEEEEMSVREEMLQRWKQTEWGKSRNAKEGGPKNRWVGTSFDIGTFLGVYMLEKGPLTTSPIHSPPASPTMSAPTTSIRTGKPSSAVETFITASSQLPLRSPTRRNGLASGTLSDLQNPLSHPTPATPSDEQPGTGAEDSLQSTSHVMDRLQAPDLTSVAQSNGTADRPVTPSQRRGKKKQVRYDDTAFEDEPIPPSSVLARSGQEVAGTSAGAVEVACADIAPDEGGVLMRG